MASDKKYPGWLVPFGLVVAIFGAFAWLQIAAVEPYAPQAFGAGMLVFFFLKWVVGRKGFSNILPDPYSIEIIPLAFALLLLIGSSGGSDSAFFPLMYVLLLLLVLSTNFYTTVITTAGAMLFVYGTSELDASTYWQALLSIPLMVTFFMYTEHQLQLSRSREVSLKEERTKRESAEEQTSKLGQFIQEFLRPKLRMLIELGQGSDTPKATLLNQIDLLLSEADKVEKKLNSGGEGTATQEGQPPTPEKPQQTT